MLRHRMVNLDVYAAVCMFRLCYARAPCLRLNMGKLQNSHQ